jgi:FKBP-type peptidyl-prolyl cis-trans isomerase
MVWRVCLLLVGVVALAFPAAGCSDTVSSPSGSAPYSQTDLVFGTGATAETGKTLTVSYAGWFYEAAKADKKGVMFTTSEISGPAVFIAGANSVIEGWEQGVLGMKEGGTRRLILPPSLAYGQTRYSAIPPNSSLVFELTLLSVQ